jgi:hypothetical protein
LPSRKNIDAATGTNPTVAQPAMNIHVDDPWVSRLAE